MAPGRLFSVFAVILFIAATSVSSVRAEIVEVYDGEYGHGEYEITEEGLKVLHLKGTPYQMGYQHGWLLHEEVIHDLNSTKAYLQSKTWDDGVGTLWEKADHVLTFCRSYIPQAYIDEIAGLIDGVRAKDPSATISETMILKLHVSAEVLGTSFLCTQFVAFKSKTVDEHVIHARNLEWDPRMDVQGNGLIVVYEGTQGYAFANFTWAGYIGAFTGVNQKGLMCGLNSSPCGDETFSGIPMPFQVRQILEQSGSVEKARQVLALMHRTLGTNMVVSTGRDPKIMRAFECSATRMVSFTDNDPKENYYRVSPGYLLLVQPPGIGVAIPIQTNDAAWGLNEFQYSKPTKDAIIRTNNFCDYSSLPEPMLKLQVRYFWDQMRDNILNYDSYPNPYPGPAIEMFYAMTYKAPDLGVESPNTTVRRYFDVINAMAVHEDARNLDIDAGVNILKAVGHPWTLQSIVVDTTTLELQMSDAVGMTPSHQTTFRHYDLSKVFPSKITLDSPTPPASFDLWEPISLRWTVTGDAGELVNVEYSKDAGTTWNVLDAPRGARLPAQRGYARLRPCQEAEGAEVLFRVVSTSLPDVFGVQGPFRIGNPTPAVASMQLPETTVPPKKNPTEKPDDTPDDSNAPLPPVSQNNPKPVANIPAVILSEPLRIIEPAPGLPVSWGNANVRWTGARSEPTVDVLWRDKPDAPWQTVAAGIPNRGISAWAVPKIITARGELVVASSRNRQFCASLKPVRVTPVKVVSPDSVKSVAGGANSIVRWSIQREFGSVDVQLVADGAPDRVIQTIARNVASGSSVVWRVPTNPGVKTRIRIGLSRLPDSYDLSDTAFWIIGAPSPATAK
ncbi:MAG TPA: C45 family autoproteolytic acyltransferase/hydrolase [Candidatus Brocadiia bacterium]|nr:C45 family autoproteolytic acyltransferase/hydrolase [Candidatus Brocadiia bacterium]